MLRASLRGIWDHKFRTILLGLAVVAGVSFVSASFIFTDTISSAFDGLFASSAEGLDVNVTAVAPEGALAFSRSGLMSRSQTILPPPRVLLMCTAV